MRVLRRGDLNIHPADSIRWKLITGVWRKHPMVETEITSLPQGTTAPPADDPTLEEGPLDALLCPPAVVQKLTGYPAKLSSR